MHYGLQEIIDIAGPADEQGYRLVTITLEDGDTAYAPGTTKYDLAGTGDVMYQIHATGVRAQPQAHSNIFRTTRTER